MNTGKHTIANIFTLFVLTTAICAMIFQPIAQTYIFTDRSDTELISLDSKDDSNERESQEDDSKEEKIELQIVNTYCYDFLLMKQVINFGEEHPEWDFNLETHIPPPEQL